MIRRESAQILALQALAFVAADDDLLAALPGATGPGPRPSCAPGPRTPHLLAAVVDFLLSEDARVLAFAAEAGNPPRAAVPALRAALPGGDAPHWT
jgi:hypothetical protein